MKIYGVHYSYEGIPYREYFLVLKEARQRYRELKRGDKERDVELIRDTLPRPNAELVRRILNNEGYVIKRETLERYDKDQE